MKLNITRLVTASVLLLALVPTTSSATPYSSLYVFGDSLSDVGNATIYTSGALPSSPPYYPGHYSNGPVAAEILATNYLGTTLTPSLLGGNDYAVAGATTGTDSYIPPLAGFTGMQNQVDSFASTTPAFDPNTTLFMLWGGANDFFLLPDASAIAPAITNLASEITMLASVGAQHFLVPGLPDLGITPFGLSLSPADSAGLSLLSQAYNFNLDLMLASLGPSLGVDIVGFDVAGTLSEVINNAASYGFTNTTGACVTATSVCANPDEYIFWDDVHPTTRADVILASQFAAAIPEPSELALLLAGAIAFVLTARKRKSATQDSFSPGVLTPAAQ